MAPLDSLQSLQSLQSLHLRNLCAAYLFREDQVLLLKRAENRKILPGYFSGVGGHLEPEEINAPETALYREILEETGITKEEITSLSLRYIVIRKIGQEIRQSYLYFGDTTATTFKNSAEGSLFWVPKKDMPAFKHSASYRRVLEHYLAVGQYNSYLYLSVVQEPEGALVMDWIPVNL